MRLFHRHKWYDESTVYYPPYQGKVTGWTGDPNVLIHGATIVTRRCSCGDRKQEQFVGRIL